MLKVPPLPGDYSLNKRGLCTVTFTIDQRDRLKARAKKQKMKMCDLVNEWMKLHP